MATVDKTWSFLTDNEGLTDAGVSAITALHDSAGNPGGSLEFTGAASGLSETARGPTGVNWEAWGVPAGATVTSLQIISWERKRYDAVGVTTAIAMRVVDSGAASVHSAGDLISVAGFSGVDASFQAQGAGTSRAVDAGKQASTTQIRLEVQYTQGSANSSPDLGIDNILLRITYTAAGGDATVTAVPADGTGDLVDPTVQAGAVVTAPPLDGTGQMPSAGTPVSSEVVPPPASGVGDIPTPAVTATGDANVVAPPADGVGDIPAPTVTGTGDANTVAPPADGTGAVPAPAVAAAANVSAPAADGTGDIPDPVLPGLPVGSAAPSWVGSRPRLLANFAQLTRRRR